MGRIRPGAGGTGTNSDRCHRCLKSGLGAKFGPRVNTRAKFGPEVEPGSWIPSWNQAWELDSDLKESLGPGVEAPIDLWELDRELKSSLGSWTRSRDSPSELDSELESILGLEFGSGIDPGKAGRAGREVIEHFWLIDPPDFHHIYYRSFLRSYLCL